MKKNLYLMATAIMVLGFTACSSDNDDNPTTPLEPEALAECTIMWYGTGGGNVDPYILTDFR